MSSNDKYTELGVTFKVLEPSDQPIIMEFLMESFFPDEPIMRSLKLLEGSGMVSNYISGLVRDELVDPCLLDGQSIAAIDKDGTVIGTSTATAHANSCTLRPQTTLQHDLQHAFAFLSFEKSCSHRFHM